MITAISNVKTNNKNFTLAKNTVSQKQKSQIAFAGSPIGFIKNESKISRFAEEIRGGLSKAFKKLTNNNELPFSKKPLTANGEIIHDVNGSGVPLKINVPDFEIKETGTDGLNIYRLDKDIQKNNLTEEAEALIKKEVEGLNIAPEREIDPSKIVFDQNGMPIMDIDGKPICEISDDIKKVDFDNHNIEQTSQKTVHTIENVEPENLEKHESTDFDIDDYLDPYKY